MYKKGHSTTFLLLLQKKEMIKTEYFPLVDETGQVIGKASRKQCHSGTFLLHPVVHLHVFNLKGELFLQKRAEDKDIQPGKWDTSVGGHVDYGEEIAEALVREVREELGIIGFETVFIFRYIFQSAQEREMVNSFYTVFDGKITPDPVEISEGKFWKIADIKETIGKNIFTPNFESEFQKILRETKIPFLQK